MSLFSADIAGFGTLSLLLLAIGFACAFEFINGFHDTANSVATVIYTRSLKPWTAVLWSGLCNFAGVFLGGISVAMGIVKLLPVDLLAGSNTTLSLITVFAMLISSCIWNLATWFYGIPASSSHALIGGILGVGVGNAVYNHLPPSSGVNWVKAGEVGLSLLISPLLGFVIAAISLFLLKRFVKSPTLHRPAAIGEAPPLPIRMALIGTSSGVSLAHGSNDGQKGVGLVMLILIAVLPAHFALSPDRTPEQLISIRNAAAEIEGKVVQLEHTHPVVRGLLIDPAHAASIALEDEAISKSIKLSKAIQEDLVDIATSRDVPAEKRLQLRSNIYLLDSNLTKLERSGYSVSELKPKRKILAAVTEYAPSWVILMIAISLGLGTLIGWKRVAITLGEKIGTSQLTYAQGAVSQAVAMSMIGVSALAGVPVSTTHCLSSGIAGSMVGAGSGVQAGTARSILLAWVLTLPVTLGLSAGMFIILRHLISI